MDTSHFISLQTPLTLEHSYFQAKENVPMETIETDSNNITKKNTQIRIHPPSMKGKNRNRSSTKDDINSGSASNNKMLRPRSHSTKNISKAKIKTIKLTMAVILGYIICSAPFCLAQIWSVFINPNIGKLVFFYNILKSFDFFTLKIHSIVVRLLRQNGFGFPVKSKEISFRPL